LVVLPSLTTVRLSKIWTFSSLLFPVVFHAVAVT
jgi:hypothetical protein